MVHYSLVYDLGENFVKFCQNVDIKKMEKETTGGYTYECEDSSLDI